MMSQVELGLIDLPNALNPISRELVSGMLLAKRNASAQKKKALRKS